MAKLNYAPEEPIFILSRRREVEVTHHLQPCQERCLFGQALPYVFHVVPTLPTTVSHGEGPSQRRAITTTPPSTSRYLASELKGRWRDHLKTLFVSLAGACDSETCLHCHQRAEEHGHTHLQFLPMLQSKLQ